MGLFSGGNSRSDVTNNTTTQNTSFSEIDGNAIGNQGDGNTFNLLDQGAIAGALNFASDSLRFAEQVNTTNAGIVGSAVAAVADSRKTESENTTGKAIQYAAYAGIAVAIAWAIRGWAN